MDKKQDLLWKLADLFDKNNIPFSLACGTLLGAYRDKNFIPWDENDVDIMTDCAHQPLVNELIEKNGWKVKSSNRRELAVYLDEIKLPLHIDIFFTETIGEYVYLYSYKPNPEDCGRWTKEWRTKFLTSTVYPYKTINFLGRIVGIPNNTELFFESIYGKKEEWSVPKIYKCTTFDMCKIKEDM